MSFYLGMGMGRISKDKYYTRGICRPPLMQYVIKKKLNKTCVRVLILISNCITHEKSRPSQYICVTLYDTDHAILGFGRETHLRV